ncbi:TRAP transporter small permease subunit [Pollutimonas sp. H1-120]|uniref:TRAP transporter small permease n=1 Tax=Pollutimonas sp. H1-120 TaxID=3148824 RepID=UPI003B525195
MTGWTNTFENRLYSLESVVCAASLLVMLAAVAFGVCIRFFDLPIPNVAEWAIVAMSPLTFVGSAMCSRMQMHISVDFIEQARSEPIKRAAHLIVAILMLVFSAIYAWLGWSLFEDAMLTGERLLDMGTPLYVPACFFFIGMVFMAAHSIFDLARFICLKRTAAGVVEVAR